MASLHRVCLVVIASIIGVAPFSNAVAAEGERARPADTTAPTKSTSPPATATAFKCSPRTQRCNCTGRSDCDYMKQTMGGSCGPTTCTGKGNKRKCECTIGASK